MKSYVLYRIVPFSMTLSDPEPKFQGHSIVLFKGEYLTNGASDTLQVWFWARIFGIGSNGAICGSIKSKMAADGHIGMTLASAGLSCILSHAMYCIGQTIKV